MLFYYSLSHLNIVISFYSCIVSVVYLCGTVNIFIICSKIPHILIVYVPTIVDCSVVTSDDGLLLIIVDTDLVLLFNYIGQLCCLMKKLFTNIPIEVAHLTMTSLTNLCDTPCVA